MSDIMKKIIYINIIVTLLVMTFSNSFGSEGNVPLPKVDDIIEWLDEYPFEDEELNIYTSPHTNIYKIDIYMERAKEIHLMDKSHGFLIFYAEKNWYPRDGRSIMIVLPEKKQAIMLSAFGEVENVYDFDNDGVSEVEIRVGAYQGGVSFDKYKIVQFDGVKPIVLYETSFSDNSGCCGEKEDEDWQCGGECDIQIISWKFSDINQDGIQDLIEEKTILKGTDMFHLTTTKETAYYIFKDKKYTQVKDTEKLHLPQ